MRVQQGIQQFTFNPFESTKKKSGGGGGDDGLSFLVNFEQPNFENIFLDESPNNFLFSDPAGNVYTNNQNPTPKFGINSMTINNATDGAFVDKSLITDQFTFDGAFSIAAWIYVSSATGTIKSIFSNKAANLAALKCLGFAGNNISFYNQRLCFFQGSLTPIIYSSNFIPTNQWTHVIMAREEDGILALGNDGTWVKKQSYTDPIVLVNPATDGGLDMGGAGYNSGFTSGIPNETFVGNMDSSIITKGRSVHSTTGDTYTVPTAAYSTSS